MSNQAESVAPNSSAAPATGTEAAKTVAHGKNSSGEATAATKINSLADLKEKAPEVWKQMLISIATTMISQMHNKNEELKKMMREGRRQS